MEDPTEQLDRFAEALAAFRPAQAPSPAAVHYAAGLLAGRRAATRRLGAVFAGLVLICSAAVLVSARKSADIQRLEKSVAALQRQLNRAAFADRVAPTVQDLAGSDEPAAGSFRRNTDAAAQTLSRVARSHDGDGHSVLNHERSIFVWRRLSEDDVQRLASMGDRFRTRYADPDIPIQVSHKLVAEPMLTVQDGRNWSY